MPSAPFASVGAIRSYTLFDSVMALLDDNLRPITELLGQGDFSAKEWLDPESSEEEKGHAIGRFNELFTNPLTLDRIDEFLDAVAR